ncbi:MAG: hypothetical protein ACP5QT_01335 [Brevinematia bacterium]
MNFKSFILTSLFLLILNVCFSESKWNIILGNWRDLSDYKDKSISVMLKKSILSQLKREKEFEVRDIEENDIFFDNVSEAHNYCISNKSDIIVYGYYYVEGKSLYVITEVWDALKKQIKMRNEARGVVTIDIFDTIDQIALNIKEKIKEVLPSLTFEEEVEIKKLRQTVYEKEEVKIERVFYSKIGFNFETGHKKVNFATAYNNEVPIQWSTIEGNFPEIFPILGFMIRIWDIRVDFSGGSMPGWPVYRVERNEISDTTLYTMVDSSISYYLPFWGKKFAFGVGILIANTLASAWIRDGETNLSIEGGEFNPLTLKFLWNPDRNLEFAFSLKPFLNQSETYVTENERKEYKEVKYKIPLFSISAAFFFLKEAGIEGRVVYSSAEYIRGSFASDNTTKLDPQSHSFSEILSLYLGIIYRVDFLEIEKEKKNE